MSDTDISIGLKTVGADQAAAEIKKVSDATAEAASSAEKNTASETSGSGLGMSGMLDQVPEKAKQAAEAMHTVPAAIKEIGAESEAAAIGVDELMQRMDALKQHAAALQKETHELGQKTEDAASKLHLARAASTGVAIGAAILRERLLEVAKGFASIDPEQLRKLDPVMADQAASATRWVEALSHPIDAIQRLISGSTIKEAFDSLNEQLALNAKGADVAGQNNKKFAENLREETKAADDATAALHRHNQELDAKDKADAAARDRTDAAAIRGGAAPEDVKAQRAKDDGAKEIEQINRELDAKAAGVNSQNNLIGDKKFLIGQQEANPNTDPKELEKSKKELADMLEKFERAKADFASAQTIAAEQRRGIRESTSGKVEDLGADKHQRIQKEQQKLEEEGRQAIKKQQAADDAEQRKAESDRVRGIRGEGAEAKIGRDAVKLLPAGVSDQFRKAVEKAAAGLQDGDQGGEIKELTKLMNQLAKASQVKGTKTDADLAELRRNVALLNSQISSARTGK